MEDDVEDMDMMERYSDNRAMQGGVRVAQGQGRV
jgi:hypothetical protein